MMGFLRALLLSAFCLVAFSAYGADCRKTGSVCVDATAAKVISGVTVSVSSVGGCWEYEDTYECLKPNAVNYCAGLEATAGCWQASSKCVQTAFNGTCMKEQWTYRCGDPSLPTPINTIRIDDTHTIIRDEIDASACDPQSTNPDCELAEKVCVEGAGTRIVGGVPVTKECWRWEEKYSCATKTLTSTCNALIDKGCTFVAKRCISNLPSGACSDYELVYNCMSSPGQEETYTDCGTKVYCLDGATGGDKCYDASSPADKDFGRAVATMEAVRQAGLYGDQFKLFKGVGGECRTKNWGLSVKCCDSTSGAKSNHSVVNDMMMQGLSNVGEYAMSVGSKFAFDSIYPGVAEMTQYGFAAIIPTTTAFTPTSFSPSVGMFGLSIGASGGMGATQVASLFTTSGGTQIGLYFNPYAFAFAIAMMVYQELISCEEDELILGVRKGAGLCEQTGTSCEGKIFKTCKQQHCCYNSKLARIINEQGKAQIGKDKKDCGGFSPEEFERLDFSVIDMSEFINDVMSAVKVPTAEQLNNQANTVVNRKVQEFYGQ